MSVCVFLRTSVRGEPEENALHGHLWLTCTTSGGDSDRTGELCLLQTEEVAFVPRCPSTKTEPAWFPESNHEEYPGYFFLNRFFFWDGT